MFRAALIVGLDGNEVGWKSFTYLVAIVKPCRRGVGLVDWVGPLAGVGLVGQGQWCKSACVITSHTSIHVTSLVTRPTARPSTDHTQYRPAPIQGAIGAGASMQ